MEIPGFIVSIDHLPVDPSIDPFVDRLLLPTQAKLWIRASEEPSKGWIWYETETLARQAHSVLHLATRPEDVGGNWYTALVGPPTFALTETDLNILLVTLQATSAASTAPPVPSAEAFATAPTSAASHAEGSLPSCRPEVGSWRGDAFPDVWLAKPASTTFRIKFVEVAKGHTISKSFVKALIEQGIGKEFVDDISFVQIRPGYPYSDNDHISKYNLDIEFKSLTRFITFMESTERTAALAFMKEHVQDHGAPSGSPDAINRPPTFPYIPRHRGAAASAPTSSSLPSLSSNPTSVHSPSVDPSAEPTTTSHVSPLTPACPAPSAPSPRILPSPTRSHAAAPRSSHSNPPALETSVLARPSQSQSYSPAPNEVRYSPYPAPEPKNNGRARFRGDFNPPASDGGWKGMKRGGGSSAEPRMRQWGAPSATEDGAGSGDREEK